METLPEPTAHGNMSPYRQPCLSSSSQLASPPDLAPSEESEDRSYLELL
jgi:hypothetical protein